MKSMNENVDRALANSALEDYDFGSARVEAVNGWETCTGSSEMTCTVFLKFEEDEPDDDSHAGCFTVDFNPDGSVKSVSCSCNGESV